MVVGILANDDQFEEIKKDVLTIEWIRINSMQDICTDADAFIILKEGIEYHFEKLTKPVIINSVAVTLKELNAPDTVLRINGWNSFLIRNNWEVAGIMNENIEQIFATLNKKFSVVPDEPGFIAARIIAMIINEAYFALGAEVSSKSEIDIAMKLGTNYPYGPFEWAGIIGIKKIFALLYKLSFKDKRYVPAPFLQQEEVTQ